MTESIRDVTTPQRKGRPPETGEPITVRLQRDALARIDAWVKLQTPAPSRPEAIRRLIERGLAAEDAPTPKRGKGK